MRNLIITVVAAVSLGSAVASEVRTATWFADHPEQRRQVVILCLDNPGEAKRSPNCDNAWQGDVIAATRNAQLHVGANVPPSDPRYWRDPRNADARRFWAMQCDRAKTSSAHVRQSMSCDAIQAAGG